MAQLNGDVLRSIPELVDLVREDVSCGSLAFYKHGKTLCKNHQLDDTLQSLNVVCQQGLQVPRSILYGLLHLCIEKHDLNASREAHTLVIQSGWESNGLLGSLLVRVFALSRDLLEACLIFSKLSEPNVYTWSAIISAYADHGYGWEAIKLYQQMQLTNVKPDGYTFVSVLKACANAAALTQGKLIHAHVIDHGFEINTFVGNTLVDMYAKCGNLESSREVFNKLPKHEVVTWNAMITGYTQYGHVHEALALFQAMQSDGISPNNVTWNAIISGYAQNGHGGKALEVLYQMQKKGRKPDNATFVNILKACSCPGFLNDGKVIHALVLEKGCELDIFVGCSLIDMYIKGGSVEDAHFVFGRLPERDMVTFSAMIAGYAQHGHCHEALRLLWKMQEEGFKPNNMIWNAMIAGYAQHGHGTEALHLFQQMEQEGEEPDTVTYVSILKAFSGGAMLEQGKFIYSNIVEGGFDWDVCVGSSLINMYAKCASLEDALRVFDRFPKQHAEIWNTMIAGYAQHGRGQEALQLYHQFLQEGGKADAITFVSILRACSCLAILNNGKLIHTQILESGLHSDCFVNNTLIDMYANCGSLWSAFEVFNNLQKPDLVSWNAMISGYVEHGWCQEAFQHFQHMLQDSVHPDGTTFVSILKACTMSTSIGQGTAIHSFIIQAGFDSDVFVGTAIIDMYAKCGQIGIARQVFDKLPKQDVVTWSAMIEGYCQHGHNLEAFQLFLHMQEHGRKPDDLIYVSILKVCTNVGALDQGKMVHSFIIQEGLEPGICACNSLIGMYGKCGSLEDAQRVFDRLQQEDPWTWNSLIAAYTQSGDFQSSSKVTEKMHQLGVEPNNVTWNTMISGYAQHGYSQDALMLYKEMQKTGSKPDNVTFVSILKACSNLAVLNQGKHIHDYIAANVSNSDFFVDNILVNMYAKCGSLKDALIVFHKMPKQDIVTWNAVIGAFALDSDYESALCYFEDMQQRGLKPDEVTFGCLLSACCHAGLVHEGCRHFKSITQHFNMTPAMGHYNLVIHLLGCAGYLAEAEALLQSRPFLNNIVGWTSLLSNCRTYGSVKIGCQCFDQVLVLNHRFASGYVLMENIYADGAMRHATDENSDLIQLSGA